MASLQNASPKNTPKSLAALGASRDPHAIDTLLKALDSRDKDVRNAAVESLLKLDGGTVLAKRLTDPKQPERTRQQAALGLRVLKLEATVPALVSALSKDGAGSVRAEAALALSMFGAVAAEDALITALDDQSDDVRYYAADALGEVKTAKTRAALQKRQQVEDHMAVQLALKGALAKNG